MGLEVLAAHTGVSPTDVALAIRQSSFDGIIATLKENGKIGSIKYKNNNKLQWWVVPEHMEKTEDGYQVKPGIINDPNVAGMIGVVSYKPAGN